MLFRKTRFDQWPVGLKWGLEALVVVFVIVTVLSLAPWEKVLKLRISGTNEVVLTELNKNPIAENPREDLPKNTEIPEFVDEGLKSKDSLAAVAIVPTATKTSDTKPPLASPTPQPVAKATPTATPDTAASEEETESESAKPVGGFLYRGHLEVTNLDAVGPKIAEKILEIGGRKAGEVELGWQKTLGSAYFHFTIPEAKYGELNEFLGSYGKPRLNLEKHPRVMPDGIIRLIVTVDEAKK